MKDNTKASIMCVAVALALFRAMFFPNSEIVDSAKFLLCVATIVVAYSAADTIIEHTKLKQRYQEKHLRMLQRYYEQMIEVERNDPRRIKNLEDVNEFMAMYDQYKKNKKQGR